MEERMKTAKRNLKILFAAAAIGGGLTMSFATTAATAMPVAPLASDSAAKIEHVRWVCGAYGRCWWRPNYYGGSYGYAYAPRPHYWRHRYWRRHHW
jgi:hypothetical protein